MSTYVSELISCPLWSRLAPGTGSVLDAIMDGVGENVLSVVIKCNQTAGPMLDDDDGCGLDFLFSGGPDVHLHQFTRCISSS